MRSAAVVTQAAIKRAVKGMASAGVKVERVEVKPDGTIVILPERQQINGAPRLEINEWDDVLQTERPCD